jgi:cysteine sulfinate desulfinase/cysteine desulfurase-like protein
MRYPDEEARGALRLSLGRATTAAEIAEAAELVVRTLVQQRESAARLEVQRAAALRPAAAEASAAAEAPAR